MRISMEQQYKFYLTSRENFMKVHGNDSRWIKFYADLDKEMNKDIEIQKKAERIKAEKGEDSLEYREVVNIINNIDAKWFEKYIRCGNFINSLKNYSITLDDNDIDIWNYSIEYTQDYFKDINIFKKIAFNRIDHSKKCICCGGVWKSEKKIDSDRCPSCSKWEIIFDMYEIAYETDYKFIMALMSIKEFIYSHEFYQPKSYDFRKKLEDRGIYITANIERVWNLANDELQMQKKGSIGRWEYDSPGEKLGKGIKGIFGSLFK